MTKYKSCRHNGVRMRVHRVWLIDHIGEGQDPSAYVIHHKDGNGQNNDESNLVIMTKHEHDSYHARVQYRKNGKFAKKGE